jgi:alcohol dehydrogenase class IV
MRAAIPVLPYRTPKILHSSKDAAEKIASLNLKKVFLVTDKGVEGLGLTQNFKEELTSLGIKYVLFDKTVANPTIDCVEEALSLYKQEGCDCLAAIGGGSSMDLAKACGARVVKPKQSINKMGGLLHVHKKLPPLFAFPTTAGTGSETTLAAVICDSKTHRKFAINDFSLIPEYAVLDYKLTLCLPKQLTAYTGMDALTHAVEAFIGRSTTRDTRAKAIEAVKLIYKNLTVCYDEPTNSTARENMLLASHYAGIAFTKSYVGYVHAVAHSLSGKYGLGHGLTNAVLLPTVLEMYGSKVYKKLAILSRECGLADKTENDEVAAKRFINWIKSTNEYMNIPTRFEEIKDEDIPQMAVFADKEANPLYPVPTLWDKKQLENVYYKVKK